MDGSAAAAAGVRIVPTELRVREGGSASYTVNLVKAPTADVTIAVTRNATGDADLMVNPASLTFTSTTWRTRQTVTVSAAVDDDAVNGLATFAHAATSTDTDYNGIAIAGVNVYEIDLGALPARPAGFGATAGANKVVLSWDDPDDSSILRWQYRQKTAGAAWGAWTNIAGSGPSTVNHEVGSLVNGTAYAFQVRAVNPAGAGVGSAEVMATPTEAVQAAPGQVTGVSAAAGPKRLTVAWSAVSGATGYKVQWKSGSENFDATRQAEVSGGGSTSYVIVNLEAGTAYTVRVIAVKVSAPDGEASETATGTPLGAPLAPTGLSAAADGQTAIDLSWTAPAADAATRVAPTGYKVEVSPNGTDSWTALATITGAGTTTYRHTGLSAGTTRHYRVKATSSAGDGPFSSVVSATTSTPTASASTRAASCCRPASANAAAPASTRPAAGTRAHERRSHAPSRPGPAASPRISASRCTRKPSSSMCWSQLSAQ